MVQEVQTGVGVYNETTLETIEAIGTSSFRIVEGRQTKGGHYSSGCNATGNVKFYYYAGDSRDSDEIKSDDLEITSSYGKQEVIMRNGGIRVPSAGIYQIELTWGCSTGTPSNHYKIIIKAGGEDIYSKEYNITTTETVTLYANLGKFDTIEVRGQFHYGGSADVAMMTFATKPTLIINQL